MKPNKIKSNWFTSKKEEKKQICRSFERTFDDNPEFNEYIENQYNKMVQEKNQNPTLIIPNGFKKFIHTKSFGELLRRVYDYMESFLEFQRQFEIISKKEPGKTDSDPIFRILREQSDALENKCKEISYAYMGILLGYGDNKMVFKDQYFFETMLYFMTQILHQYFEGMQAMMIDQELNRMFRTNAFNLIKRRHIQDEVLNRYPFLKELKYDGSVNAVRRMQNRLHVQKKNHYSMQLKGDRPKMLQKPVDINLSTFNSVRSRSPLIASFYPSQKQKLHSFGRQVREKQSFIKGSGRRTSFAIRKRKYQ